jgi:2-polyprenyl-6-methoxyphenol hydroxylase-like FAD-dependent oxidoreductase
MGLKHYDAVIVGARCAGAATAMLLARSGLHVLAIDRSEYASDTVSTHALMRGGVLQLHRWGLLPSIVDAGTPPVREAVFHFGDESLPVAVAPRYGVDALYAPRRTILDRVLVDAARTAGAEVKHGLRVVDLLYSPRRCVRGVVAIDADGQTQRITTDIVIGADGMRSTVARLVDVEPYRVGRFASGTVYAYWNDLNPNGYQWHWQRGVAAGEIPTNHGWTCVFAAVPASGFRSAVAGGAAAGYRRLLQHAAPRLMNGPHRSAVGLCAFSGQVGFIRQSWGPGWALVGDASYYRDPIAAYGITDALRDADLLARAVVGGTERALADYQAERDASAAPLFELSDRIASFAWDLQEIRRLMEDLAKVMAADVKAMAARPEIGSAVTSPRLCVV